MYGWGAANPGCSNWVYAITNPWGCYGSGAVEAAKSDYNYWFGETPKPRVLASPGVPAGALDPAEYYATPETIEESYGIPKDLRDQQMRDQQIIAGGQVHSSWTDELLGGAAEFGDAAGEAAKAGLTFGVSGLVWLAVGLGAFGLVALSGGGPRRFGR